MNHDESQALTQTSTARPVLPRHEAPGPMALPEPVSPLLLPAPDPASSSELPYVEQDIDGYTIAEAHAALEAFKHRRRNQA